MQEIIITADVIIAISYTLVSGQLLYSLLNSKLIRTNLGQSGFMGKLGAMTLCMIILFMSSFLTCGATHLIHVMVFMNGGQQGFYSKLFLAVFGTVCAVCSTVTAIVGLFFFPMILRITNRLELNIEGKVHNLEMNINELMETVNQSIMVITSRGRVSFANTIAKSLFNMDVIGNDIFQIFYPSDIETFQGIFANVMQGKSGTLNLFEHQSSGFTESGKSSGSARWLESSLHRRLNCEDLESQVYEIVMVTRDITQKKELAVVQQRKDNEHAKMRFILCVAHDLKTPLQSFNYSIQLLYHTALTEEQKEIVDHASVAVNLMRMTISQTMDIGKVLNGGTVKPRKAPFSLRKLMTQVEVIISGFSSMVPIHFHIASEICDNIISDEEWIRQNVLNFLTNACKYTTSGHIKTEVTLNGSMILFEVADTGIGVNPSKYTQLFEAFSQGQIDQLEGTGLGLFGIRCRVEGLGGTYGVRPNYVENKGSVFWFEIPYLPDLTETPRVTARDSSARKLSVLREPIEVDSCKNPSTKVSTATARTVEVDNVKFEEVSKNPQPIEKIKNFDNFDLSVYVIDDAPSIRKLSHRALNKLGISKVETFVNGVEGLEAMMKHEVDIVFTDFQMPLMTGPEMVSRFREYEADAMKEGKRTKRQVIIGISANLADDESYLDLGFEALLPKPFDIHSIVNIIEKYTNERTLLGEDNAKS